MKKAILSCLSLMLLLSSCVKEPTPVPVGEAKVRFINAGLGSSAQDCYVNSDKKNSAGLVYGQATPSYTFTSGGTDFLFTNQGSTTISAGTSEIVPIGASYSVFYLQNTSGAASAALASEDNAVVEGKAKVRFIHLNISLSASIKIATEAGTVLTDGVGVVQSSNYFTVDPGTKFVLTATGVTAPPVVDGHLAAGKNYTIWFSGSSATELTYFTILQN